MVQVPGLVDVGTYEIVIGTDNNQRSVIRQSVGGENVRDVPSPDILSCTETR